MQKPNVAALYNIPKADDERAGEKLLAILREHEFHDEAERRTIANLFDAGIAGRTSPNKGIVAYFGLLPAISHPINVVSCKTSFEFLNNDTCVVNNQDGQPTVYDSWQKGYARLIHDIHEYWRQREIDAGAMASSYKLLYSRLTA